MSEAGQDSGMDGALERAMLSLEGLSCGDAFGECFFPLHRNAWRIERREVPPAPWMFTDDTMMAISIAEMLRRHREITEADLATHFAELYDPGRGYGAAMHGYLTRIGMLGGAAWREEAGSLFGGRGSYGNGSAMRVAPLGAYFADDPGRVVEQAAKSAATTHAHDEAVAGAIAVALGAAFAWRVRGNAQTVRVPEWLEQIRDRVPPGEVRTGIDRSMDLPDQTTARQASMVLGNGSMVSAMDTVPFALWCAGRNLGSYEEAMWQTVSSGGDMDTTCAMVGGIVVLQTGIDGIPAEWRRRRESLGDLVG